MSIYVDFHVLQTVPPCCVNRDDTGSPKTAIYGGVTRARVSSQSWKHAMRSMFVESLFENEQLANRTKFVIQMVRNELNKIAESSDPEVTDKVIENALNDAGLKIKDGKSDALFFFSTMQAKKIAELIKNEEKDKKVYKTAIAENPSVDIALFGRMVASDPTLNIDATAQVAHAISTHAVQNEYDYFTAVDDLQDDNNAGAGHLGTVEFNSSTLYRYANINATELANLIGKDSIGNVISKFAQAFICSMPTGKENTFANRTLPDAIYITVRDDQPVNLCNAFENPVKTKGCGYALASEEALVEKAKSVYRKFIAEPKYSFCIGDKLSEIAKEMPLSDFYKEIQQVIETVME